MKNSKKQLFKLLDSVEGSGQFAVSGVKKSILPGMEIQGFGEIGFPLTPYLIKGLIEQARKAPFGKGSQTVLDTNVRSAWEIDASEISFLNEKWEQFVAKTLKKVQKGLGIKNRKVKANLYKLLIYETGDFFLPHQDSEKEKGMFGTLIVGLPSKHTGGALYVRFGEEEKEIDFSSPASNYQIPFAAFFADCEHEIKPVTSGYRVCLAYNLIQKSGGKKLSSPEFSTQTTQVAEYLKNQSTSFKGKPIAILLGHQYTPTNFSSDALKLNDAPRAEVLMKAAEASGYFAKLGLVTNHISGELEVDYNPYSHRHRYRDYQEEPSEGTMGEIYENDITVNHWSEDGLPNLGDLLLEEDSIWTEKELGTGEPIAQEQEGYTGNAGMTLDYWYHYGAVILWPKNIHAKILDKLPLFVRLNWIAFYLQHWDNEDLTPRTFVKEIITEFNHYYFEDSNSYRYDRNILDLSNIARGLVQLNDEKLLIESEPLLTKTFLSFNAQSWIHLMQTFSPPLFGSIFKQNGLSGEISKLKHLLEVLVTLYAEEVEKLNSFVRIEVKRLPIYLKETSFDEQKREAWYYHSTKPDETAVKSILNNTFVLSHNETDNMDWVNSMVKSLTKSMPRFFVNDMLLPALLESKKETNLTKSLKEVCIQDLKLRTAVKPTPPSNWTRALPKEATGQNAKTWEMLKSFLLSPREQVFEYRAKQSLRDAVVNVINAVDIDLRFETIKRGSPYTLRIIKTQTAYEKDLKHWTEDMALLEQAEKEYTK